ncbi:hypothetical protein HBN50_14530 [Halobacteriovorax sp. GB3]|uniref:hypothetical protein n=1 Tax=Halobacteriovorax sp. GB3 TaxID=2719615 RepID=UPI00235F38C4|nr:hypothetical protein [Halobacteriovorax sp. GB3]MDD0854325.1 hypothetical protein [Halobacteriovorax sp. GB3]
MNISLMGLSVLAFVSLNAHAGLNSKNIDILNSIPLIKAYEAPRDDEKTIQEDLIKIFNNFAIRNRNADSSLNRGTHAKGQCFDGDFQVFSANDLQSQFAYSEKLINRLKQGLFKSDGLYSTSVRLANADGMGRKQSDKVGDVRGLSFSVYNLPIDDFVEIGRQDFMMNSTPGFSNGGIKGFYEVVKTANLLVYKDITYLPNPLFLNEIVSGLSAIGGANSEQENITSLADSSYWSNIPYTHGMTSTMSPIDIVKLKAEPCSRVTSSKDMSNNSNYLQEDIVRRANEGTICFDVKLQFFNRTQLRKSTKFKARKYRQWSNTDWIENGGLEWPESVLPFYTVARIQVPKNSPVRDCSDRYINTRVHANLENLPIGSISRVRTYVEEASRANRMRN